MTFDTPVILIKVRGTFFKALIIHASVTRLFPIDGVFPRTLSVRNCTSKPTHVIRMGVRQGAEELYDCAVGSQVHAKGWHHALLSKVQGSQASSGDWHGGPQGVEEIFHIIVKLLKFSRFLQLVCPLHILHHSIILKKYISNKKTNIIS